MFANAQTGNVVLMTISIAKGDFPQAFDHLPSLMAFIAGLSVSQQMSSGLRRRKLNSRNVGLGIECVLLTALGIPVDGLSDHVVTACVGFIAGVQITSLSHIGAWSFNTGMTTGNLRGAVSALSEALAGSEGEWAHALVMTLLCVGVGALAEAWLTPILGGLTLLPIAALVAATIAAAPRLDPISGWSDLR